LVEFLLIRQDQNPTPGGIGLKTCERSEKGCLKKVGKSSLVWGITGINPIYSREAEASEERMRKNVQSTLLQKPCLPDDRITMIVKESLMGIRGRHGSRNREGIPITEWHVGKRSTTRKLGLTS
jgi:hypothetical protein